MILPSDEDSRKPNDPDPPGKEPDDELPWEGGPKDPPGFFGEEEDDEAGDGSGKVQSPAPPGWREELKEDLSDAIADLKEIEDPAEDFDPPEPPDLFTFYGELAALRNEMRRASRQNAEAFQQLTGGKSKPGAAGTSKAMAEALVNLFDHLETMEMGLLPQLASVMKQAGLQQVKTTGAAFDSVTMITGEKSPAGRKVIRELMSGWLWNGETLRPAQVTVA